MADFKEIYENDVAMWFQGNTLVIDFDDGSAKMELSGEEAELVKILLNSNDFWAQFLGSLSAALGRHR